MKREYKKTDIEVVYVKMESLLNTHSSEILDSEEVGDGQVGDDTPDLSKYHNTVLDEWQ